MTKKDVFDLTVQCVVKEIEENGFKFIKSKERIIRKTDDGYDAILFRVVDYCTSFQIVFDIRTRTNVVEDILNKFMADCMNPQFMSLTETIIMSYQELSNSKVNYIEIASDEQLNIAISEIIGLITGIGMDFFEQNKNVEKVNVRKKNAILYEHKGLGMHHDRRTLMQSLILMKLCNDPDFDLLKYKYKELYVPFDGEEISGPKAIDDLISYLENM